MRLSDLLRELIRPYYLRWVYFPLHPSRCPPYFRTCWAYPYVRLPAQTEMWKHPDCPLGVLFFPMNDWHGRFQRTQQLARALVRGGATVVYINPHLGREYENVPLLDPAPRLAKLEDNIFELHVRLPREPVFHHRTLESKEVRKLRSAVQSAVACLGIDTVVQVLSLPVWLDVAETLRSDAAWPLVYDCHDFLAGFRNIDTDIIDLEHRALNTADFVMFSSENLLEHHSAANSDLSRKSRLFRNAVDPELFTFQETRPGQVATYIGALDTWFDVAAVQEAALQNPQCRFLLAGRIDTPAIRDLRVLPNVEFLGEVPYSAVPSLLAASRIGLVPFVKEDLTRATNPIKVYEYFACGLPVASTSLPEVEAFGDQVYTGSSPTQYAVAVRRALEEDDRARRRRRRAIAEKETWDFRAAELRSIFEALISPELPQSC